MNSPQAKEVMECLRNEKRESDIVKLDDTLSVMKILDECRKQAGFKFDFE